VTAPDAVVKVGGSLLDWPGLPARLADYLESRRGDRLVLIVGCGKFADTLRDLDARHALGEEASHGLALRLLGLTAHVLAAIVPGLIVVDDIEAIDHAWSIGRVPILAPRRFLDDDDRSPDPLPHAWSTTTDAIAARLASRLGASELALLKSVDRPEGIGWSEAARLGIVDPEFERVAAGLRLVTFRNLRR